MVGGMADLMLLKLLEARRELGDGELWGFAYDWRLDRVVSEEEMLHLSEPRAVGAADVPCWIATL